MPVSLLLAAALFAGPDDAPPAGDGGAVAVSFNRDVRPLLAKRCFACHGPDDAANESGLRLDEPGHGAGADVLDRIASTDEYTVMPPPESGPPLTPAEADTLRAWVRGGADYEPHWAFVSPTRPRVPDIARLSRTHASGLGGDHSEPPRNPIDSFVDAKLAERGLTRSPAADQLTLARRVALDLTGIPPTPAEAAAFAADPAPGRLRTIRRPAARLAAVRGAVGPAVARSGPVFGHQRLREGPGPPDLALPRLGRAGPSTRTCRTTSSACCNSPGT